MIVLSTLNARYTHASFGLRYLLANLGPYRDRATLREFTIKRPPTEIVDEILRLQPRLVGFGVYIWNTDQTLEVVRLLRERAPGLLIVLGGPEISFETETQPLFPLVDFIFKGESDFSFRDFVANWIEKGELPPRKIIAAPLPDIKSIRLPYREYSDEDIAHRTLYVEASRGCPYKCEYCLSSLDVSVRNFDTEAFLAEIDLLLKRGARQFKFVDRTFNLSPAISSRILSFFLERIDLGLFLHFEMVPDRLPDELKDLIKKFPAGSLQFEIGIQTWNPEVAKNVSRRQNYEKIRENLQFLRAETGVHTHADLIVGLPGETWDSFAAGFNELARLWPDEVQVGILKRLKGTPIVRHDQNFQMLYSAKSPFQIQSNRDLTAGQLRELEIFADFWDLVANSGRFAAVAAKIRARDNCFEYFLGMSRFLFAHFGRTHSIHLRDLTAALELFFRGEGENPFAEDGRPAASPSFSAAEPGVSVPARQRAHLQNTSF
jgi:radical SAM superfamily enzyme YgiQ (UPF0313 family)